MAAQIWTKMNFSRFRCCVSHFLLCHLHAGAGAPERNPGQRSPGSKKQLDQQGLHLPANLHWRGASQYQHTQRRSPHSGLEPARWLPLCMERQEAVVASQRESRKCLTAWTVLDHPDLDQSINCSVQYGFNNLAATSYFVH